MIEVIDIAAVTPEHWPQTASRTGAAPLLCDITRNCPLTQ